MEQERYSTKSYRKTGKRKSDRNWGCSLNNKQFVTFTTKLKKFRVTVTTKNLPVFDL